MRDENPDDPDEGGGSGGTAGPFIIAIVAAIVSIFAVLSFIGGLIAATSTTPPSTATCTDQCWGFVKLECPTNRYMGACFGFPGCGATTHKCGTNP
jgi:hypothetical protein